MSKSYILSRMDWAKAYRDYETLKNEDVTAEDINALPFPAQVAKDIRGVTEGISDDVFERLVDNAKLNWLNPVDSYDKLPKDAEKGDTVMTREDGYVYRFDGEQWIEIQQIDAGPVNELDSRLSQRLAEKAKQVDLETEAERINNLVAHAGNTDGNAELLDMRVAYGGETFQTAGESVRALGRYIDESLNVPVTNLQVGGKAEVRLSSDPSINSTHLGASSDGDLIYYSADVKSTGVQVRSVFQDEQSILDLSAKYRNISFIKPYSSTANAKYVSLYRYGSGEAHAKNRQAFNLTETFGKGNEPSVTEMNDLLSHFNDSWVDGTKNLFNGKNVINKLISLVGNGQDGEEPDEGTPSAHHQNGYIITNGDFNVNFPNQKLKITGDRIYVLFQNKMYRSSPAEVELGVNSMQALVFDTVSNKLEFVGISANVNETSTQWGIKDYHILLGLVDRTNRKANINVNTLQIDGKEQGGSANALPKYITDEVDRVVANSSAVLGDLKFVFATDIHLTRYSDQSYKMKILAEMGKSGAFNFVAVGGDTIDGGESKEINMKRLSEAFRYSKDSPTEMLVCQGNHDTGWEAFYPKYGYELTAENVIRPKDWHNIALKHLEDKAVFDEDNPYGGYYYRDYNMSKIRIIVMNSVDYFALDGEGNPTLLNPHAVHLRQQQITWLHEQALNFMDKNNREGWEVVILTHAPLSTTDPGGLNGKPVLEGVLKAFMDGSTYSGSDGSGEKYIEVDCDFTEQGPLDFICSISGHLHYDRVRKFGLFDRPSITVGNLKTGVDYKLGGDETTQPEDVTVTKPRIGGELSAELFDVFTINKDERTIHMTRFGAGEDRVISY